MATPSNKRVTRLQQTIDALLDQGANGARKLLQSKFKLSDIDWLDLVRQAIVWLEQHYIADPGVRKTLNAARLEEIARTATTSKDKIAALRELNAMYGLRAPIQTVNQNLNVETIPLDVRVAALLNDEHALALTLEQNACYLTAEPDNVPK